MRLSGFAVRMMKIPHDSASSCCIVWLVQWSMTLCSCNKDGGGATTRTKSDWPEIIREQ